MLRGLIFSFGLLGTFIAIIFLDQPIAQWISQEHLLWVRANAREVTDFALGEYWFGLSLVVMILTYALKFAARGRSVAFLEQLLNLRRWAIHFFCALLGAGIFLQLCKHIIGRQRPHLSPEYDPLVFQPLTAAWHFHSLPSGHAQVMFTVASVFTLLWPRWAAGFYAAATFFALTRVLILQHFLSDIVAGALVGYFGSLFIRDLLKKKVPLPTPLRK